MKNFGRSAAVAAILGLSIGATQAATVNVGASGFFGSDIAPTAESAPGQTFTFSFITSNPISGNPDTSLINPTFSLSGTAITPTITSVTFHDAGDGGLFDLTFSDQNVLSLYGAGIDTNGVLQSGFYLAAIALNGEAPVVGTDDLPTSVGSVSVSINVSPVPLPASAPMFGAALLGLGILGYAMKRSPRNSAPA
jgi:hypothetical protein